MPSKTSGQRKRAALREFREAYGKETVEVIKRLCKGWDSVRVSRSMLLPVSTIAAYQANLTRGTYGNFPSRAGFC